MVRKVSFTATEEELDDVAGEAASRSRTYNESPLDARMLDLDDEADSPFLRGQKRVPVRRGPLPRKAASRLKVGLVLAALMVCAGVIWFFAHRYAVQSWRFRIDSSDDIVVSGAHNVSRSQVMDIMAADIDRNVFFVPLDLRKKQLEQILWVQSASVARILPNRITITLGERTPVAFVDIDSHIELIDAQGVVMDPPLGAQASYSFPVVLGTAETDPLSTRAAQMKIYMRLMKELDAGGAHYSRDLSDVDLSEPDDVKATVTDPQGAVLVHLGSSNFLERFKIYVAHVQEWRTQFPKLKSVDLRYEHQVIVNPDVVSVASIGDSPAPEAKPEAAPKKTTVPHKKKHQ